jgi:hypothetical protein
VGGQPIALPGLSKAAMKLDRQRSVHLGILRSELRGRRYERFFRWEMDPLPEHVREALAAGGTSANSLLARTEVDRLLEPGYLSMETGHARSSDGMIRVAVLTEFPGATGEMIDWWFGWHGVETARYKLWHPQAHLFSQTRYQRASEVGLSDRAKYIGNTSYVDEYVGPLIHRLAIRFVEPREFGFSEDLFEQAGVSTAICAHVGFSNVPVDTGHLVHLIRETTNGCEMRSRFWLGDIHLRPLPGQSPLDHVLSLPFLRRRLAPDQLGAHLLVHCAEEMNHLAGFLPELFAQERSAGGSAA